MMYQPQREGAGAATLEDYIRAIRSRFWVLPLVALIALLLALIYLSGNTSLYTAQTRVQLGPTPVGSAVEGRLEVPNLELEREIMASNANAQRAADSLGVIDAKSLLSDLDVKFTPDSDVLQVSYTSTDPETAAEVADAIAGSYVATREGNAASFYAGDITLLQDQEVELERALATANTDLSALEVELANAGTLEPTDPTRAGLLEALTQDRNEARTVVSFLQNDVRTVRADLNEVERSAARRSPAAVVIRDAVVPGSPDGVANSWIYAGALIVGLLFGTAVALIADRLDTTARHESAVADSIGAKVLGSIPRQGWRRLAGRDRLVMLRSNNSTAASQARESFRRLRSSRQFMASTGDQRCILFTSAYPGEGKSFTVINTAIAMAQSGSRVAVVCADMRRPGLDEMLDLDRTTGLSMILKSAGSVDLVAVDEVDGLWILPAGPTPDNASELLALDSFAQVINELKKRADYVLVDSPPALLAADAATASSAVDGVVVVVDSDRTETLDLDSVRSDLERAGAEILGAVMNRVKRKRSFLRRGRYGTY